MRIESSNSDMAVLSELGARLARTRLEQNVSQQQLAFETGVSKATIERLEAGEPVKSTSLIRVLRSLGRLEVLDQLLPEPLPSPIERLKLQGGRRQRARARHEKDGDKSAQPWRWADEDAGGESG